VSNRRPKLIATDLDGTIVPHDKPISQRTISAFTRAYESGVKIFFVTGRPPRWMTDVRQTFDFGDAICCNGALWYDLHKDEILEEWPIHEPELRATVTRLRLAIPNVSFAIESDDHFHREKAYIPRWDVGMDNIGVGEIEEVLHKPSLKLLARLSQQEISSDEMLEIAKREVSDLVTVTHSADNDSLLEISALGISKGETLAKKAAEIGIGPEDVVTFGDNPNDFSMLSWSGRSYAMASGHRDGVKYAKSIAPACEEDGVAQIIEELLDLPE
jgi:Cof subfamily protein (haloacid dehalogenase superfamily)